MTSSMYIVPPIACEKTVISLSITLLPLALFYFLYGIDWERMRFGLGLVGFIYTFISLPAPYMEFYNFALSMSTALLHIWLPVATQNGSNTTQTQPPTTYC